MIDVALAACDAYLDLHPDDRRLRSALEARGLSTTVVSWTFEAYDWSGVRCCLPRNTWDYPERPTDFAYWLKRVDEVTKLWNPAPVLAWNHHKSYLLELGLAGVPIVETALFTRGSTVDLAAELEQRGWQTFVLKPAIGATAREASCFARGEARRGQRHLDRLLAREDVLLQPFLASVRSRGETSLVYLEGGFSHAVLKRPAEGDWRAQDEHGGTIDTCLPREDEIEVARAALAAVPDGEPLLYARVDLVRDGDDRPLLSELELIEPSLYFGWGADSAERLAGAIFARLLRGQ
jgi:glutathione synthase/RimK-type ligase-like ATP-grasp enzyme